jgi:hypothetical protein
MPAAARTFAEVWVLAGSLRALLAGARPALPADLGPASGRPVGDGGTPRAVDVADLRARAVRARDALAAVPAPTSARARRLVVADRLAAFGIGGGADPGSLPDAELAEHVTALMGERDERLAAARAALDAYDAALPDGEAAQVEALTVVLQRVWQDRLPVLPVVAAEPASTPSPFVRAWTGPASSTRDAAQVRPWLSTMARVRPGAARLVESVLLREALGAPVRLRVVQMSQGGPDRWVGLPFGPGGAPLDAVTACVVDAPQGFSPRGRCVGLVVDGWSETVPRRRTTASGAADLVTTGVAVHANGPDARAPQSLLLAISPDGGPWTWQRLHRLVEHTLDLARARMVTLETAPLGGALLPAVWAQDWSLQGEQVPDPRLLAELRDTGGLLTHVRELEG